MWSTSWWICYMDSLIDDSVIVGMLNTTLVIFMKPLTCNDFGVTSLTDQKFSTPTSIKFWEHLQLQSKAIDWYLISAHKMGSLLPTSHFSNLSNYFSSSLSISHPVFPITIPSCKYEPARMGEPISRGCWRSQRGRKTPLDISQKGVNRLTQRR